jgi:DNA-binding IclR family transcriptional regulator
MQGSSKQDKGAASPLVENLIVLNVLREDHPDGWTVSELHEDIGYEREDITDAVESLRAVGVVVLDGEQVRPSQATARINALDMICI